MFWTSMAVFSPGQRKVQFFALPCMVSRLYWKHRPKGTAIQLDDDGKEVLNLSSEWVKAALENVSSVNGTKEAMSAHLIRKNGTRKCPNASKTAVRAAKESMKGKTGADDGTDGDDESSDAEDTSTHRPPKRKKLSKVKAYTQKTLSFPKGIDIPFSDDQKAAIKEQFGRATQSANLPFRWIDDVEVIKLFLMFRSRAEDVLPDRKALSGPILDAQFRKVEDKIKKNISGQNVTMSVNVSTKFEPYLVELRRTNKDKKDAVSYCQVYENMIDTAESTYGCTVVAFCTDDDGGGGAGRVMLIKNRPWLFGVACSAHQVLSMIHLPLCAIVNIIYQCQLVLGDYFKENKTAAQTSEDASELIGWILNHSKVREIFDEVQIEKNPGKDPLTYTTANLMRWTTHFGAFDCLQVLKEPLRHAAFLRRDDIVVAQVGAERNTHKRLQMKETALANCNLLLDDNFWDGLQKVLDDIEPLCYAVNINQSDSVRPDQVLLSFAGLYIHFSRHSDTKLASAMKKRLEKRWKSYEQELLVFALVLNPFERLDRFGSNAQVGIWTMLESFKKVPSIYLYKRVNSRPQSPEIDPELQHTEFDRKLTKVSKAFAQYMSFSASSRASRTARSSSTKLSYDGDPIQYWESNLGVPAVSELAEFSILILSIVVNSASDERLFSNLRVKASIRADHFKHDLIEDRKKRHNHSDDRADRLLAVPRYHDLLEDISNPTTNDPEQNNPRYISSRDGCGVDEEEQLRERMRQEAGNGDDDNDIEDDLMDTGPETPARSRCWLPITLEKLFGGSVNKPLDDFIRPQRRVYSDEVRMMELLAAEYSDEPLDDGELSGSGDDFDG
ncbi:hypothetical protein D9758_018055 [Tetrapyrgos nigripes]|uniref:HAT C-terminal dimerisation domain-containing protein n=1 Tax=Tetrapyrgos nigripes TaxID=182062 RepID=A0A8H5BT92_9AGAR|nr:hypothetical protein D9758_018055 [Tetrapyrgos nigripes]